MAEITAAAVKALRDRTGAGMMDCKRALGEAGGDPERAVAALRERGLSRAGQRRGRETGEGVVAMSLRGPVGALVELGCETDFVARTGEFKALAGAVADAAARHPEADAPDALLRCQVDGETLGDRIDAAIAKLGENVAIARVTRLAVEGPGRVGGYIHAGEQLGAAVALRTEQSDGAELDRVARDLAMHVAAVDPSPVALDRAGLPADLVAGERAIQEAKTRASGAPTAQLDRIVTGRLNKFYSEVCLLEQAFVKAPSRSITEVLREASEALGGRIEVTGYVRFRVGEAGESGDS